MNEQLSIFDWMPTLMKEPEAGEWVYERGAVIPRIMRSSYIGKKVLMDYSTSSITVYKVGILEKVVKGFYWSGDQKVDCDMSIVYDGTKQRCMITHYPGHEIFECLPWDAYEERSKAIGRENERETC